MIRAVGIILIAASGAWAAEREEPAVAWGPEANGVRLGITSDGPERTWRGGETARFIVLAHNAADGPREFAYAIPPDMAIGTRITDAAGKVVPQFIPWALSIYANHSLTLAKGETREVGRLGVELVDEEGDPLAGGEYHVVHAMGPIRGPGWETGPATLVVRGSVPVAHLSVGLDPARGVPAIELAGDRIAGETPEAIYAALARRARALDPLTIVCSWERKPVPPEFVRRANETCAAAGLRLHVRGFYPAEPAWGPPVRGVDASATLLQLHWKADATPQLKVTLRNLGTDLLNVTPSEQTAELRIDGTRYRRAAAPGAADAREVPFPPGAIYADIPFALDDRWRAADGGEPMKLAPGRHDAAVIFTATPMPGVKGKPVRPEARFELDVAPADPKDPAWGEEVAGVSARLMPERATWTAGNPPVLRAEIRNMGPGPAVIEAFATKAELEVDGARYALDPLLAQVRTEPYRNLTLLPGARASDVAFPFDRLWRKVEGGEPLHLLPGRHVVRLVFHALVPAGARVATSRLEMEQAPIDVTGAAWGPPEDGLTLGLLNAEPDATHYPGDTAKFRLFIRNAGARRMEIVPQEMPAVASFEDSSGMLMPARLPPPWDICARWGEPRMVLEPGEVVELPRQALSLCSPVAPGEERGPALPPGRHLVSLAQRVAVVVPDESGVAGMPPKRIPRTLATGQAMVSVSPVEWGDESNGLAMALVPEDAKVVPGMGVRMRMMLRNVSTAPVKLPWPLEYSGFVGLTVTGAEGGVERPLFGLVGSARGEVWRGRGMPAAPVMAPGEIRCVDITAWDGRDFFRASRLGKLTFRAQFPSRFREGLRREPEPPPGVWSGTLESSPVTVTVVAQDASVPARIAEIMEEVRRPKFASPVDRGPAMERLKLFGPVAVPEVVKLFDVPGFDERWWALTFLSDGRLGSPDSDARCCEILSPTGDPSSGRYGVLLGALTSGQLTPRELSLLQGLAIHPLINTSQRLR